MALTPSTMLELGTQCPDFRLPDYGGHMVGRDDFSSMPVLLVMFICNHCPYVKHVRKELGKLGEDYSTKGVGVVGINSNDAVNYPEDSPERMKVFAKENNWRFSYLCDDSQDVAKAFRAACTPDFYVFDGKRKLVYRGQLDDSRPDNGKPVTGNDVRSALDGVLAGKAVKREQKPSLGCNIKWKPGNEPEFYQ